MLQAAFLSLLFCSAHSFIITKNMFDKTDESSGNTVEDDDFSISTLLEKANKNLGKNLVDPVVMEGDIAVPYGLQNADPCTANTCRWPKASDGNVYVPYRIAEEFSQTERDTIISGLNTFAQSTCIRFTPHNGQRDFVDIQSLSGCWSYVGRQVGGQKISLKRDGCIFQSVIQHEILHALGFHHEQGRSDRDLHVRIHLENVISGLEYAFNKHQTNNLGTPYDYNSVMHYGRYAFSKNRQPTIVPIPDPNAEIGRAEQMSPNDILRINRLYGCRTKE